MLEVLLGNKTKEQILLYLYTHGEGYAQAIRKNLDISLRSVQLQLKQLEEGGVLVGKKQDRAFVYQFNTRYPFYRELVALIERLLQALPEEIRLKFYTPRLRPRRIGKPL